MVTVGSILIESRADDQLRAFRLSRPPEGTILDQGLWALCRHPNYAGEIGFWWGLFLFAVAADGASWPAVIGPAAVTALFLTVSIPIADRRSRARRPGYEQHMRRVPALIPRLRRARDD